MAPTNTTAASDSPQIFPIISVVWVETVVKVMLLVEVRIPPTVYVTVELTMVREGRSRVCVPRIVELIVSVVVVYAVVGVVTEVSCVVVE